MLTPSPTPTRDAGCIPALCLLAEPETLSTRLRQAIEAQADLSLSEVAHRAGLDTKTVSNLVHDKVKCAPRTDTIGALAAVLGVTCGWLAYGEGTMLPQSMAA